MDYKYSPTFQHHSDDTPYRLITTEGIRVEEWNGEEMLVVEPQVFEQLAYEAFRDLAFYLRPNHLKQVAHILDDDEASKNDRFVAEAFLKNAIIAAVGELPSCQDTGTAIAVGYKGSNVWNFLKGNRFFCLGIREWGRRVEFDCLG